MWQIALEDSNTAQYTPKNYVDLQKLEIENKISENNVAV